jgi:hypothetical protein
MKFAAAASRFDRSVFTDAANPATSFKGQFDLFGDVLRDSITSDRRVLSVAPDVTLPASRVVNHLGTVWMVGDEREDFFNGEVIRKKYVLQQARESTALLSFDQAIAAAAGTPVWASRVWVKPIREPDQSSLELGLYEIYLPHGTVVPDNTLIRVDGRWHLTRVTHPTEGGFVCAQADELLNPVVANAVITTQVYNKLTDTRTPTNVNAQVVSLRWQSYFSLPLSASKTFERGDDILIVRKADCSPKAGDRISTTAAGPYNVISVLDIGACWSCHVRRT